MHYCIIAKDCNNCPLKRPDYWCPAEKLEPFWLDFIGDDEEGEGDE